MQTDSTAQHRPESAITYLHLSSGAHAALNTDLLAQWTTQLGPAQRLSTQHAMWHVQHKAQSVQSLKAQAHTAAHDYCELAQDLSWADFSLLAMDMDSTLINIECIDEIADYCGKKAQVSAITEAAMRGDIKDFNESLVRRVALLKGLPVSTLQAVLDERLRLNPGAEQLIQTAHERGLKTLLVSGGFTFFTDAMHRRLGLSHSFSNTLVHHNGILTGEVKTPIVNAQVKRETVQAICRQMGVADTRAIAMGDGSNDLDMMSIAGLSVAYHAKPAVQEKAMSAIRFGGLNTLCLWLNHSI